MIGEGLPTGSLWAIFMAQHAILAGSRINGGMQIRAKKLPQVSLHAFRHSHASALIASGQDVVTVSRRMGHSSPTVTLAVYAHLFDKTDEAATAIDAILKPTENKS